MLTEQLISKVKENLNITGDEKNLTISDVIQEVMDFCYLTELPDSLEPFIRRKVQGVINYEAENGTTSSFDIKSIKEGDSSITYNIDEKTSKERIYGLSDRDKSTLRRFRRLPR